MLFGFNIHGDRKIKKVCINTEFKVKESFNSSTKFLLLATKVKNTLATRSLKL